MYSCKMLIGGLQTDALSGLESHIKNPANGELVATVPKGDRQDACRALEAANDSFKAWSKTTSDERASILHDAARIVRERSSDIATKLTLEMGKPIKDSKREVMAAADVLDYYAEEGKRVVGEWIPSVKGRGKSLVIKQPIGVSALITPWNFPIDLMSWKVGPSIAAGCTIVAKPPSGAPLAATELILALMDAGAPPGVVNVVHGPGSEVGAELVENPISRKIAFTGESSTGRWIMAHAAARLKRVSLELGGHAPLIVFDDADLKEAVGGCVRRAFNNMGQICISVNRVYVDKSLIDEFVEMLVDLASKLRIGNGLDPDVDLGPMYSESQRQKTKDHISDAVSKGAKVVYGGSEPEGHEYSKGFFFKPTILVDVDHSMKVMREETFGPVAPVMPFGSEEEALRLANDSDYGLAAYVFTKDLARAFRVAEALEAGGVGINVNNVADIQAPFGGWKQSGFGRELSHHGLDEYLEIKHIKLGI